MGRVLKRQLRDGVPVPAALPHCCISALTPVRNISKGSGPECWARVWQPGEGSLGQGRLGISRGMAGTEQQRAGRDARVLAEGDVLAGEVNLVAKWIWLISGGASAVASML